MENNFCFKSFILLGVHPGRPLNKLLIAFNTLLALCCTSLSLTKFYFDRDLGDFEPICGLIIITVQYLMLPYSRKSIKQILEAMKHFWDVSVADDEVTFFVKYFSGVTKMYKGVLMFAVLTHSLAPFFSKATSIFNCYIPPYIPFPILYMAELYILTIVSVTVQFRLVNLRIKNLNSKEIENDHDVEVYVRNLKKIIRHQQFLMRCVDDLNKFLCVPVALVLIVSVSLVCITTYNITVYQKPLPEKGRMVVIILTIVTELFLVYGLPGESLIEQSAATADEIYSECKWYLPELQPLRNDFLIMIVRSQKVVCLMAGNYHVLNNGTPLLMLKTAYSFCTFLQNVV